MKPSVLMPLFRHSLVRAALGVVVVIAIGSGVYYLRATRVPDVSISSTTPEPSEVTGSGVVEAAQNPELSFQSAGRIVNISGIVGKSVLARQILASLDISSLEAQRAQSAAALKAQQAKLDDMKAGARAVDIAAKQTAVDQASAALSNVYASIPSNVTQAYDKSFSGVAIYTDGLFTDPNVNPKLISFTTNAALENKSNDARWDINTQLKAWKEETLALSIQPDDIPAELAKSLEYLAHLRSYADTLLETLATTNLSTNFSQSTLTGWQTSVTTLRDTVNTQILALQSLQQQITTDTLAVSAAQNALDQLMAGSTPQAITAQKAQVEAASANIAALDAQIRNGIIAAPFGGTISSVHVKVGDTVTSGAPIISLNPEGALEIDVLLTEIDIGKIAVGDKADVTLDAYGTGSHFEASVVSIDRSPTTENGTAGYKTVLQFAKEDPSISPGMTANIIISITH